MQVADDGVEGRVGLDQPQRLARGRRRSRPASPCPRSSVSTTGTMAASSSSSSRRRAQWAATTGALIREEARCQQLVRAAAAARTGSPGRGRCPPLRPPPARSVLDALGDGPRLEPAHHARERVEDHLAVGIVPGAGYQVAVELVDVGAHVQDHLVVRLAKAHVVERDREARLAQLRERAAEARARRAAGRARRSRPRALGRDPGLRGAVEQEAREADVAAEGRGVDVQVESRRRREQRGLGERGGDARAVDRGLGPLAADVLEQHRRPLGVRALAAPGSGTRGRELRAARSPPRRWAGKRPRVVPAPAAYRGASRPLARSALLQRTCHAALAPSRSSQTSRMALIR